MKIIVELMRNNSYKARYGIQEVCGLKLHDQEVMVSFKDHKDGDG